MRMPRFKSQSGSALVMVLMIMLIIGAAAGTIASWGDHMNKQFNTSNLEATKNALEQSIKGGVFESAVCNQMISRSENSAMPTGADFTIGLSLNLSTYGNALVANSDIPGTGLRITKLQVEQANPLPPNPLAYQGVLVVGLTKTNNQGSYGGTNFPDIRIPSFTFVDNPGNTQFTSCSGGTTQDLCTMLGGKPDGATPPKCELPINFGGTSCAAGEVKVFNGSSFVCQSLDTFGRSGLTSSTTCQPNEILYSMGSGLFGCVNLAVAIAQRCAGIPKAVLVSNGQGSASCLTFPQIIGERCPDPNYVLAAAIGVDGVGNVVRGAKCVPFVAPLPAVNCVGGWGACSASCGPGTQTFSITTPASGGGAACAYSAGATQACNLGACGCNSQTISNCDIPPTANGSSAGSCASGYSGSCSYSCNSGTLNLVSNSCSVSTPPVQCYAKEITISCGAMGFDTTEGLFSTLALCQAASNGCCTPATCSSPPPSICYEVYAGDPMASYCPP